MSLAKARCSHPSTEEKGRNASYSAQPHSTNTSNSKDSNPSRERKPILHVMRPRHPARVLVDIGLAASMQDAAKSAKLYDALLAAKEHFYRSRGRRVPTEAEIDAERYPEPRQRKGARHHA